MGMLYGLRYGATWFLYFTNAETRIRRLFGLKPAVDDSYTGKMKAKMKSMFGGEQEAPKSSGTWNPLTASKQALMRLALKIIGVIILLKLSWMAVVHLLFGPKTPVYYPPQQSAKPA